jgi:hypothetical protein
MKNYWLKIIGSALGIFAVGMALIIAFRGVKTKVTSALNSSDPIPIPLIGLVPFRLGSDKLGSVSRVEFLRSDPEHVSGVRVLVKLADSVGPDRLRACKLAIDNVDNLDERTSFRCQAPEAALEGLEPFGVVVIKGSLDSFPLLLPGKAVTELRQTSIRLDHGGLHVNGPHDPVAEALAERSDSLREALSDRIEARSDSVDELKDLATALEDSATSLGASPRRRVQASADSVRGVMRLMVDRMKADEARQHALEGMSGLTPGQIDSLSHLGDLIGDSLQRSLARELQRTQVEIERVQRSQARVEAVAPPAPPVRPARPR